MAGTFGGARSRSPREAREEDGTRLFSARLPRYTAPALGLCFVVPSTRGTCPEEYENAITGSVFAVQRSFRPASNQLLEARRALRVPAADRTLPTALSRLVPARVGSLRRDAPVPYRLGTPAGGQTFYQPVIRVSAQLGCGRGAPPSSIAVASIRDTATHRGAWQKALLPQTARLCLSRNSVWIGSQRPPLAYLAISKYPLSVLSENDKEAIRCVQRVIEAMQDLRRLLEMREEVLRRAISVHEPARDYTKAVKDAHMSDERDDFHEALFLLEQRRRESRVASFRSALDHGVSINELGRIWGFSRQMASRYAKEARGET